MACVWEGGHAMGDVHRVGLDGAMANRARLDEAWPPPCVATTSIVWVANAWHRTCMAWLGLGLGLG